MKGITTYRRFLSWVSLAPQLISIVVLLVHPPSGEVEINDAKSVYLGLSAIIFAACLFWLVTITPTKDLPDKLCF